MLSRIFRIPDSNGSQSLKTKQPNVLASFLDRKTSIECSKLLICGPHGCGKTSLLFSLAVSFAEEGKEVLFICPRKIVKLPLLPEGEQRPSTTTLQKIHMVYLESKEEVLKYMASIHLMETAFHCMLVDDLGSYVSDVGKNEDLSVMARLLAFMVDAYNFEIEKLKKDTGNTYHILALSVTIDTNASPFPRQNLYERWINYIIRIKTRKDSKASGKQCELSVLQPQHKEADTLIDVMYHMTDSHFTVTEVVA